ncbi:MAG TPA: hypothetical protein VFW47_04725 [Phenylobacterium sp.]|nr:hypothetical protein [Phenylobacterium sp.]
MASEASSDKIYRLVSTALDAAFYRAVNEDVARARLDPVHHYIHEGWREGRDPAPWFSTRAYLDRNPDVRDMNPFHHYLTQGWREGREAEASVFGAPYLWRAADGEESVDWLAGASGGREAAAKPTRWSRNPSRGTSHRGLGDVRALVASAFDAEFYLAANPDVAASGRDPVDHFLISGWREGRDPAPGFSVEDYLELHPDVAEAGLNPFAHYLATGRAEGRAIRSNAGFRQKVIARLVPVSERIEAAARRSAQIAAGDPADLRAALAQTRATDGALHLTVSHDDFTAHVGGVQLCLQREAAAIAAQGVDHLHLYPTGHWPTLRPAGRAPVGVLWNGRDLGVFAATSVAQALAARRPAARTGRRSFALHSLLGHSVDEVLAVLAAAGLTRGFFWLHDFTSLCAGVHLMRDDVADCGAPPPDSAACGICVYGPHRATHVEAHARLFATLDLTVVAPSQSTYDTWRAATTAPAAQPFRIHPHARLEPRGPAAAREGGPLAVAFLGMPAAHKGWLAFRDLADRFAGDDRYRFLHLASRPVVGSALEFHEVSVTAERPAAMREALDSLSVDVAVIWSLCRETFSFTAYEAAATGTAILTGPDSGNVAAFVAEEGRGRVLADENELAALFESGEALSLSRALRRPQAYNLTPSALTVDLLEPR